MDQCEHCTVRGKIKECLATNCSLHESWMVRELGQLVTDAPKFFATNKSDKKTAWIEKANGYACYAWINYPTETGWWWSKGKGKKPEMCCIVAKKTAKKDVVIAIYPERECKLYLDTIHPDIVWQKVKRYVA